jgi:hypothetical protein
MLVIQEINVSCNFSTTQIGTATEDMQLGAIWMENHLVTVSLSGYLNYISPECPDAPSRIVKV